MTQRGRIICAGLGPGDPELISVKADRAIRSARNIAYFRAAGRKGQARGIVEGMLAPDVTEIAMEYPVTTEIPHDDPEYNRRLAVFYDNWAEKLAKLAESGDIVILCEGEPFLYGSFMHLYIRLKDRVPVDVIPGIPGMAGCWNAADMPMTWGDDALIVLPGTLPEAALLARMQENEAIVIMKTGRNLPKIRRALGQAGRLGQAWLVERGTMPDQRIAKLADLPDGDCPYFAIVLVAGNGRRPQVQP